MEEKNKTKKTKKDKYYRQNLKNSLRVTILLGLIGTIIFGLMLYDLNKNNSFAVTIKETGGVIQIGSINIIFVVSSLFFMIFGIVASIFEIKKVIIYNQTLDGVEIDAEIVKVHTVDRSWGRLQTIECRGKDEAGNIRTFYTRNFQDKGIDKEVERLNLKTLTVRYKKNNPEKYVVLTERLEKSLNR